ncbi:CorA family divalent cation transporter, partial [Fangia hongkongensis]
KEHIAIYQLDKKGHANKLESNINFSEYKDQLLWIQLDLKIAQKFLRDTKVIPEFASHVLCAKDTRPRTIINNNTLLCTIRGVNKNTTLQNTGDMISVRLYVQENLIVSVHKYELNSVKTVINSFNTGTGPVSASDFINDFLLAVTDSSLEACAKIDHSIDQFEDQINQTVKLNTANGHIYSDLNALKRKIILLRRYLLPQREAILRIQTDKLTWFNDKEAPYIQEIANTYTRILEDLETLHGRVSIIYDQIVAITQGNLNNRMYVLSIITAIFLPLTFITGLLGINVGGIPGANSALGFAIVCIILIVFFILQYLLLKKLKWL